MRMQWTTRCTVLLSIDTLIVLYSTLAADGQTTLRFVGKSCFFMMNYTGVIKRRFLQPIRRAGVNNLITVYCLVRTNVLAKIKYFSHSKMSIMPIGKLASFSIILSSHTPEFAFAL